MSNVSRSGPRELYIITLPKTLIILGAIVILIGIALLAELAAALISIMLFVSFFIIVVGGAFLILRKILRGEEQSVVIKPIQIMQ